MKKTINLFIIIILFTIMSCKTSNEKKIIGKWKGSVTSKSYYSGTFSSLTIEMEFDENGKGWYRRYNIEKKQTYQTRIFNYRITPDSIIFIPRKYDNLHIEYISDNKLMLNSFSESGGTVKYELDKIKN